MKQRKRWMLFLTVLMGVGLSGCVRSCAWSSTVPPDRVMTPGPVGGAYGRSSLPLLNMNGPGRLPREWQPETSAQNTREWKTIVIHHTATSRGNVESIHEAHLKRGWLGIGYHFVIGNGDGMGDGEVEPTFRWRQQLHGAHAGENEHNQHGIGITLVGNFEKQPPTTAQLAAVKRLVSTLKAGYGMTSGDVVSHKDIKATACPGKYFPMAEVSQSDSGIFLGQSPNTEDKIDLADLERRQR